MIPVADQFYGYRSGRIQDPVGHLWIVSKRISEGDALPGIVRLER